MTPTPMRYALALLLGSLAVLPAFAAAQPDGSPDAVTVSSFYGSMTVTPDSVRYTTPTHARTVSRDLLAVLTRPDMVEDGRSLPDRADPWAASEIEAHLVFARHESGPLPAFPPLRAADDSLAVLVAEITAAADSLAAANVALAAERDAVADALADASAEVDAMQAERAATLDTLRALLARLVNPQ